MLQRSALSLLLLAAPASAQLFESVRTVDSVALPQYTIGCMLAGDVTGDFLPDLVFKNGEGLVIVYGPAAYQSSFPVGIEANDFLLLPSSTPGQAQRLLVVNEDGLHELTGYDAGEWQDTLRPYETYWGGATLVRAGDTDGDGSLDVAGLSADGDILFMEDLETTPTHASLAIGPVVRDFALLDWSGSGTDVVALLQANGFFVRTKGGTLLYSVPGANQGGHVLPIHQDGLGRDRCAVIWTTAGETYLAVVDSSELETPIDVSSVEVHSAAVGDVNGDGDDDLYLVSATSHDSKLLLNRSASEDFTFALSSEDCETIVLASGDPPGGATPWPVACDLTLDGDLDLALYLHASEKCVILENASLSHEDSQPVVAAGVFFHDEPQDLGTLEFTIEVPAGLDFSPTDLEFTTWNVIQPEEGPMTMEPVAYKHQFFEREPDDTATTDTRFYPMPALSLPGGVVVLVFRWVVRDPTLGLVKSGTPSVHVFGLSKQVTDGLLEQNPGAEVMDVRLVITPEPPDEQFEADPIYKTERELAPKEVKAPETPPIEVPPDPWP